MSLSVRTNLERLGCRGGAKIMAMPYEKDNALCSPTSALEKKRMLCEELRNPSFLTDNDKLIVERHWGHGKTIAATRS